MDGWTVKGEQIVCALCGEHLADAGSPTKSLDPGPDAVDALARLLGEDREVWVPLTADESVHFCKDCAHFLRHPFVSRCLFHDRPTEPMDDCPDFSPRLSAEPSGEMNE
jgi:hypothetical protein